MTGTTVSGPFVQDTVTINGLAYNNFIFGLVTAKTVPTGVGMSTGIFGFAPEENAHTTAALASFYYDNTLPVKQVSFYYPRDINSAGELYIGGSDTAFYSGTPLWIDITFQNYWNVASGTVFASSASGAVSSAGGSGIIDTGTSLLAGPAADIAAICSFLGLAAVTSSSNIVTCAPFCCATNPASCPSGMVNIANIPMFYLNFDATTKIPVSVQDTFYVPLLIDKVTNAPITCSVAVQSVPSGIAVKWIIGAAVLRQFYTIFDFTNYQPASTAGSAAGTGRVGFATKSHPASVPTQGPAAGK